MNVPKLSVPKFNKSDLMAGVTTGIANVPDGMASGVLAGVNPIHGVYTLITGTPVASMTISTQLMMFNTTSAMTLVAVDGLGTRTGEDRVAALIVIALVAGLFQIALGLLGLGSLVKFVPNAVMTGFLTGISCLIIMAQLWDLTGYSDDLGGSRIEKTARLFANLREIDPWTTFLGIGSIVVMILLGRGKFANFNLLIALGVATLVAWIFDPASVELVKSLGEIPRSLPPFDVPQFSLIPKMTLAAVAVAAVGLLQAAGVAQAYPNPDGSETSDSRDFLGQGVANTVTSLFSGMAGGGSLSGTALFVSAGAKTRIAGVVQAVVVLVVILVFSGLLSMIPMAALAALLIYAAFLSLKFDAIRTVRRTSLMSFLTMTATFLATLIFPLQQAVILGVVLAGILFVYKASTDVQVTELRVIGNRLVVSDPPVSLRANDVTVLDVDGSLFYAGARTLESLLPTAQGVERPVAVLRIRGQHDLGSTFFKVIKGYGSTIRSNGGRMILAGVEPEVIERMERTGLTDEIGRENIYPSGTVLGDSVLEAERAGEAWLSVEPMPTLTFADPATSETVATTSTATITDRSTLSGTPIDQEAAAAFASSHVVVIPSGSLADLPASDTPEAKADVGLIPRIAPFIQRNVPWSQTAGWEAMVIEAIALAIIGIGAVAFPDRFSAIMLPVIGVVLIATGAFWLYLALGIGRSSTLATRVFRSASSGIALFAGSLAVGHRWLDALTIDGVWIVVWLAIVAIGISGLIGTGVQPASDEGRMPSLAMNVLVIALGTAGYLRTNPNSSFGDRFGWISIVGSIALFGYAFFVWRSQQSETAAPPDGE